MMNSIDTDFAHLIRIMVDLNNKGFFDKKNGAKTSVYFFLLSRSVKYI